jgi:large subunit ribosomal protein L32
MVVRVGKHAKRKQRTKRGHLRLTGPKTIKCERCGSAKLAHNICPNCGNYRGREVIDVLAKLEKKERKKKAKELEAAREEQEKTQPADMAALSKKEKGGEN